MKGKELIAVMHEYVESKPLLRFLSKLAIVLVFIYPLVYMLGRVLELGAIAEFSNLAFYIMLFSLALLLIDKNWLILMISSGVQGLVELFLLISFLVRFGMFSINVLTDLCLFSALCVPSVLKFIAHYKATHVPKPKAAKPRQVKQQLGGKSPLNAGIQCEKCGTVISSRDAAFCNVCGNPLTIKVSEDTSVPKAELLCPVCGNAFLNSDALFCNSCGAKRPQMQSLFKEAAGDKDKEYQTDIAPAQESAAAEPMQEEALPVFFCSNCGTECEPEVRFCTSCGTPLKNSLAE